MFKRLAVICVVALLTACSPPPTEETPKEPEKKVVIATEKTHPENFEDLSTKGTGDSYTEYYAQKAENQEQFQELWTTFRMKEDPPSVDFTKKDAYFVSFYEPGSCALETKNEKMAGEILSFTLEKPGGKDQICTDDLTPRTLILEMDSADVTSVVIRERETETEVPLQ